MKIYIIYGTKGGGSRMRGIQVYDEFKKDSKYDVTLYKLNNTNEIREIKDSIILIVKKMPSIDILKLLKKSNNTIIYDIIDYGFDIEHNMYYPKIFRNNDIINNIDYVLTVNMESLKHLRGILKKRCKLVCIYHHWDPKIEQYNNNIENNKLQICYIGYTKKDYNCLYYDELDDINIFGSCINREEHNKYRCHYNVRHINSICSLYKSNVKLSTAAAAGANIITSRDKSVLELLNHDYPYLTNSDKKSVTRMIQYAKDTYNTDIWYKGLIDLQKIKKRTSLK
jgi:hypothetical protein